MTAKQREKHLTQKQKKIISLSVIALFIIFIGVITWFVGRPMVRFVSEPEQFREWVKSNTPWSHLAFIGMMVFQVVIAIVPGEPLEIGAGYAFGAVGGTILCIAGITVGSIIVFCLVRRFGMRILEIFFSSEKIHSLKFLQNEKRLLLITFLVFFIPGTPKDLLSYFVGLTDIKMSHWILIAFLARIPSIITSTIGGSALGLENYKTAIIVFAVTIVVSLLGLSLYEIYKKIKLKR